MHRSCGEWFHLKPHTSLHSITWIFIWAYKEACHHKGHIWVPSQNRQSCQEKMHREEIHFLNNIFILFFCFLTILSYRKSQNKMLDSAKVNPEISSRKIKKAVFTTPSQQTFVTHSVEWVILQLKCEEKHSVYLYVVISSFFIIELLTSVHGQGTWRLASQAGED